MTDDLIERVARAICEAGNVPGFKCTPCPHPIDGWCNGGRMAIQAQAAIAIVLEEAAKICAAETDRVNAIWRKGNKADSHLEGVSDGWDCAYVEFYKRAKEFEVKP